MNSIDNLITWTCMKSPVYFLPLLLLLLLLLFLFPCTFVLPLSRLPSSFLHTVNWCWVSTANCRSWRYLTMPLFFVVELNGRQRFVAVIMWTTLLSSIPFDLMPVTRMVANFVRIWKALSLSQNHTEYKLFTNVKIRKVTAKIRMFYAVDEHILEPARLLT